jgi:hypothetical protein
VRRELEHSVPLAEPGVGVREEVRNEAHTRALTDGARTARSVSGPGRSSAPAAAGRNATLLLAVRLHSLLQTELQVALVRTASRLEVSQGEPRLLHPTPVDG